VPTEARFATGSRLGPRSTIWKAWVHGDEAYIASRMFGSDMKASFHSSGQCQWSATDTWVRRQKDVRNSERHVKRWQVSYPAGNEALLVLCVEIPGSEWSGSPSSWVFLRGPLRSHSTRSAMRAISQRCPRPPGSPGPHFDPRFHWERNRRGHVRHHDQPSGQFFRNYRGHTWDPR
jgi:hypothetical protein